MTDEDLKEAVKLAQKTLQDAEIAYGGIKIPIGAERVLFARAVIHLTERLKRAEAVADLAAREIDTFYLKMKQDSHQQTIAEEDHDLWFARDG